MQNNLPRIFLFIDEFNLKDLSALAPNIDIIFRNYKKKPKKSTLLLLKNFCKKSKRKFYISNDIKLVFQLNIDGVYIPSFNKQINYISVHQNRKIDIIGSAHNKSEIEIKKIQGCKLIFLSPLFENKKKRPYLNVVKYNLITINQNVKFIALGGINEKNINSVYLTKSVGIAGIRWIKKNGPRVYLRPFYKSLSS